MTLSMTAFARKTQEAAWGALTWDLRSVNHRYLEIFIRLPDFMRDQEKNLRGEIQKKLQRGKVEAILTYQPGEKSVYDFALNQSLIQRIAELNQQVTPLFPQLQVNLMDLLSWQGVLQTKQFNLDDVKNAVGQLLQQALHDFIETRQREGSALRQYIEDCVNKMEDQIQIVAAALPRLLELTREKILTRFADLHLNLDPNRLEQEMVWVVQKTDIAEELSRLKAHVVEVRRTLGLNDSVGKRLDFLMQELNRETNTIASKSLDIAITQATIEMKVLIEQMREQVQNIE